MFPSFSFKFSLTEIPRSFVAASVSFFLEFKLPRVLSSPRVRSAMPVFFPDSDKLMTVPPQNNSTSSGCVPKKSVSNFMIIVI